MIVVGGLDYLTIKRRCGLIEPPEHGPAFMDRPSASQRVTAEQRLFVGAGDPVVQVGPRGDRLDWLAEGWHGVMVDAEVEDVLERRVRYRLGDGGLALLKALRVSRETLAV